MTRLVLSDEQTRLLSEAKDSVVIVTATGEIVAVVPRGFTPEEVLEAEKRLALDEPRYTTEQVLDYLRSLDD